MSKSPDLIVKAKYSQAWLVILILGSISLTFMAAGISFIFQGGLDFFYYPLITGLVGLLITLIFVLRQGHFTLNETTLEGKRRSGKPWSYPLSDLGKIKIGEMNTQIFNTDGKLLQTFPSVWPDRAPGALWLYHEYRNKLPKEALSNIGKKYKKKKMPKGMFFATRTFKKPGTPTLVDSGTLVQYGDKYLYIPETRTDSGGSAISMISPIIITRFIETPGIPNRSLLPLYPVVKDLHISTYSETDKIGYIGILVMTHLGSSLSSADLKEEGRLGLSLQDGTDISIQFH